jgi:hypothetical protein
MVETLAQTAYILEQSFLIYISGKKHLGTAERALNHLIYKTEKLIDLTYDLINGVVQDEILEGDYKPDSEFGQILDIFVRAFKLAVTSKNENIKNQSIIIMLKTLRKIVEIVDEYADGYTPNIYAILSNLENINNALKELEKQS